MPHVFLSYSRADQKQAARVAEALTQAGFDVWWDASLTPGAKFRQEIAARLKEAGCVVVLWSSTSINSDFVIDEADDGRRRGVLVQAVLDAVQPPHGFRQVQWADLQWWAGGIEGLRDVIQGISRYIPPDATSTTPGEDAPEPRHPRSRSKKRRKSGSVGPERPEQPAPATPAYPTLGVRPASADDYDESIDPPVEAVSSTRASFREPLYGVTPQSSSQPFVAWVALFATLLLGVTAWQLLDGPDAPSWLSPLALITIVLTSVGAFKLAGGHL